MVFFLASNKCETPPPFPLVCPFFPTVKPTQPNNNNNPPKPPPPCSPPEDFQIPFFPPPLLGISLACSYFSFFLSLSLPLCVSSVSPHPRVHFFVSFSLSLSSFLFPPLPPSPLFFHLPIRRKHRRHRPQPPPPPPLVIVGGEPKTKKGGFGREQRDERRAQTRGRRR